MKIVFATNNAHKLEEVKSILGEQIEVVSLGDIGCHDDIPETGSTLEANAMEKAEYIYNKYNINVFADDTGLEVDALGGAPGVHTARYAGPGHDTRANVDKLLMELGENNNRRARFRTVVALILVGPSGPETWTLDGTVEGFITRERRGEDGFGYDPVFEPEDYGKTFAELGVDVKNKISHRAKAVGKLAALLKTKV